MARTFMEQAYKIRVSCPNCVIPTTFIYYNCGGYSKEQILNILDAVKYKDDYTILVKECPHPNKYIHLHRVEDTTTLLQLVKSLRLSRSIIKETITTKKKLIVSLAATRYIPLFYCETEEFKGINYTFINKVIGGDDATRRQIANLLCTLGYSVGTSVYNDPFVRNAKITIERENHPLFKYGVWRIYDIQERRSYISEIERD